MRELVVLSGKGGTGKTSVTASLAVLAGRSVIADCDVDAADLHLVLNPTVLTDTEFRSGKEAYIDPAACAECGRCAELCRFGAVMPTAPTGPVIPPAAMKYRIDPGLCEGCGVCARFCPSGAVTLRERVCGRLFRSETAFGPMIHARLGTGGENSGKLVTAVRREAKKAAEEERIPLILVDGSPGIGCPVIASMTGADGVIIVTEPSLSGLHDLKRVAELARHFSIPGYLCVNRWDINPETAAGIERGAAESGLVFLGRIPYDRDVFKAQLAGRSVVQYGDGPAARAITDIWEKLCQTTA